MAFALGRGWIPGFSDGKKHGKSKVFQGWLLETGAFTYDDFRGFAGLHQFQRLQRKIGLDFLLPNSAYKMCHLHYIDRGWISGFPRFQQLRWPETRKIQFFKDGCWKDEHSPANSMIFVDVGSPPISASPTEYWGLIFCYQILLITCAVYVKPRVDLGFPPFYRLRWPETRKIQGFIEDGCGNKQHSPANSTIFVDLRVSTKFGVSNGIFGFDFLLPTFAFLNVPRALDRG